MSRMCQNDYILDIYSYENSYCIPKDKSNSLFIKDKMKWYIEDFMNIDEFYLPNKELDINYERLLNNEKYSNME